MRLRVQGTFVELVLGLGLELELELDLDLDLELVWNVKTA
jgi:hypothetical protein